MQSLFQIYGKPGLHRDTKLTQTGENQTALSVDSIRSY